MKSQKSEAYENRGGRAATFVSEREQVALEETIELTRGNEDAQARPMEKDAQGASLLAATGGLAVILGQLVAYFHERAHIDDLDVLSFSLHHLFCRIDFLYDKALPALGSYSTHPHQLDVRQRQQIWSQMRAINRTLDRMEPLCHLLSDAAECILERFDASSEMVAIPAHEADLEPTVPQQNATPPADEPSYFQMIDGERWEQAFSSIAQCLLRWQERYSVLTSFATTFAPLLSTVPMLEELDAAFAIILDSAGAIFGDILPGLRAILDEDEAMIAALLYDLMQQSDQLLVKFDSTLEPMTKLIQCYAVGSALS